MCKNLASGLMLTTLIACKPMGTEMTSENQQTTTDKSPQSATKIAFANNPATSTLPAAGVTTGLQLISDESDDLGFRHLKYHQLFKGVPVWASDMIMHINAEQKIYRVDGEHRSVPGDLNLTPAISNGEAAATAAKVLSDNGKTWNSVAQELMIYPDDNTAILIWMVELSSGIGRKFVMIDAHSGAVVKTLEGNWS